MAPNPPSVVISKSADNQPPLLPCPYRTGKFLGQGSYAKVKEAIEVSFFIYIYIYIFFFFFWKMIKKI